MHGYIIAILFCLSSGIPTFAADDNPLTLPAKDPAAGAVRESDRHAAANTGSYVDHVTRQYSTEGPELSVKTSGDRLSVGLTYEHGGKSD